MAKTQKQDEKAPEPAVEEEVLEFEDRIDEYGLSQFQALGYKGRLPDAIVALYQAYKKNKDKIYPGKLHPDCIAYIVTMADIVGGRLILPKRVTNG